MLRLKYIKTMDFTFENVDVLECNNLKELRDKIKENEVIVVNTGDSVDYINSNYIMFFG